MSVTDRLMLAAKFILGGFLFVFLLFLVWVLAFIFTSVDDKTSPYTVNCRNKKNNPHIITDDILMRLASLAIYDDLKENDKLELLPENAGPQTLYHMYLAPEGDFRFNASHRAWDDPRRFNINVSYEFKGLPEQNTKNGNSNRVHFSVDYQDCGDVSVR